MKGNRFFVKGKQSKVIYSQAIRSIKKKILLAGEFNPTRIIHELFLSPTATKIQQNFLPTFNFI